MQKEIKMTIEQAQSLYKTNPEYRDTILAVFTDEELGIQPKWPTSIIGLQLRSPCFINGMADIIKLVPYSRMRKDDINVIPTLKHAKSILALCQLMTLAYVMNDGWEPNWNNEDEVKFSIAPNNHGFGYKLRIYSSMTLKNSVVLFKTEEMAKFSLKNHYQLWSDYWMIENE